MIFSNHKSTKDIIKDIFNYKLNILKNINLKLLNNNNII